MSALTCGCDAEARWMCETHRETWRVEHIIWRNDRRHIAEILATFYCAPLSMSSVQPLLDLAVELNPSLKEMK